VVHAAVMERWRGRGEGRRRRRRRRRRRVYGRDLVFSEATGPF